MTTHPAIPAAALALVASLSPNAFAETSTRYPGAHATAFCQPALPAYEGLIRKRPLAVQNEGSSTAFVTCSVPIDINTPVLDGVQITFVNNTGGQVTIHCTLVNGQVDGIDYFPKSSTSALQHFNRSWTPADNGGDPLAPWASLSCALPPGTGIHSLFSRYVVEIGD